MMKMLLVAILMVITYSYINSPVSGVNYYVSRSGNDANDGLTQATAWATISKVNSSSFSAGDSILFKRGDSWNEQLKITSSGSSGNPIVVSAYGLGANPIITGLQTATGFTDSSGIWSTTIVNSVKNQNTILVDGDMVAKGRFPNNVMYGAFPNTYTSMTMWSGSGGGAAGFLTQDYTGAEAVVRSQVWILDHDKISAQSGTSYGSVISLRDSLTYNTTTMYYFVQNDVKTLDLQNEWSYDSLLKKLYIKSSSDPSGTVQYSVFDTLVNCHNVSYITFDNIDMQGGNKITFSLDTNRSVKLQYSTINYSGGNAIQLNKSNQTSLYYNTIMNAWNDGIYTRWQSDTCTFDNNFFYKIGMKAGMNANGNSASCGVFHWGLKMTFTNNRIDSIGYHGIYWGGANALIQYNYITNFCLTKEDGAGIYSAPVIVSTGSLVSKNIVTNGVGINAGSGAGGIYMDNSTNGVTIDSNTVSGFSNTAGLIGNGGVNLTFTNNISVNNLGQCLYIASGSAQTNLIVKKNTFYSTVRTYPVSFWGTYNGTTIADSNYILRANATDSLIKDGLNIYRGLAAWQIYSGLEPHSTAQFPLNASTVGVLYINPTQHDSTIVLTGSYYDQKSVVHTNSMILPSFSSALLFKADPTIGVIHFNHFKKVK